MKKSLKGVEYSLLAIVMLLIAFPFLWMLSASFQTYIEIIATPPTWFPSSFDLSNFMAAWQSGPFLTYTMNSVVTTFVVLVLQFITMIPAAYAFARLEFKGKNICWSITIICLMIPMQLIFLPNYLLFSQWGMIDTYWPLILPFATSAFGIFMLRQSFKQIPEEIIESARLDNASEWKIIRTIFIPVAKPTIITVLLFTFISRWNDYFWPLVMTTAEDARTLPMGVALLRTTDAGVPWNEVMAANVILVIPILIVYFIAQDKIIKAFTYTGIK
ncbi:carbohydrate ABC transporter permease [Caryophanon tenue]|uniref:Sugar ABC transporter permease n=1 Tax=Caryophanon tenue TaxID=33978 RepID=A0A1C0YC44_9BACL|nr:carbohydrate ABC transporter permease [Caryophanon tenue]OCS84703.1 sugar ABC transporter permease [Caryophanon tenue]